MPPTEKSIADLGGLSKHDALVRKVEGDFEKQYQKDPEHMQSVFKELRELEKMDGGSNERFQSDLRRINKELEAKGILPNLEIDEDPKHPGKFTINPLNPTNPDSPQNPASTGDANDQQQDETTANPAEGYRPSPGESGGYSGGAGAGDSGRSGSGGYNSGANDSGTGGAPYDPGYNGKAGFAGYDNTVDNSTQSAILAAAQADVGKAMWKQIDGGASGGNEGCAASVSAVLDQAGAANVSEMAVTNLQASLEKQGWTQTTTPKPGDVVMGYGGLSSAHTGIVGQNGTVFDNHSSTGTFQQDSLSYFQNWNKVVFLTPPASETHTPAPAAHTPAPATPAHK